MLQGCGVVYQQSDETPFRRGGTFIIKNDIDLNGGVLQMPENVVLVTAGGIIQNGTLVGNNTKIIGRGTLFNRVSIKGKWLVPSINTSLFKDLSYENALRDVFALTSPDIYNRVVIEDGAYSVAASSGGAALSLVSRTAIQCDGNILLRPNAFAQCYVVLIKDCEKVSISGRGAIAGDKNEHLGASGEWGMGIHIVNSNNIELSGISVNNCWGDCIYIGQDSKDISIRNCHIDQGRRQGISITSASNVSIFNCYIENVRGKMPGAAVDIEPNKSQRVENVRVDGIRVKNCEIGMQVLGSVEGASISNVSFKNCSVENVNSIPYSLSRAEDCSVVNCEAKSSTQRAIRANGINNLILRGNRFSVASRDAIEINKSERVSEGNNRIELLVDK